MLETIRKLTRLPAGALLRKAHEVSARYHESQWQMAVCLRAIETSGAYQEKQVGNAVEYAVQILELTRQKATELLRVARVLESCPLLSEAFRVGEVKWGKVREVTRVVTSETEAEWLETAKAHDAERVRAQVSMSPGEFKRQRALKESLERKQRGETGDFPGQMALPLPVPETGGGLTEWGAEERKSDKYSEVQSCDAGPRAPASDASPAAVPAGKPRMQVVQSVPAPPTQPRIRLVFDLTPEEYAVYEKAEEMIRSRTAGRIRKEGVLRKMCEQVMTSAPRRAQIRYQVLVHFDLASQTGTYETDRGVFPASPEVVERALAGRDIILTEKAGCPEAGPGNGSVSRVEGEAEEFAEASTTSHGKNSDPEGRPQQPPRMHPALGGNENEQETEGPETTKQAEAPRKAGKRRSGTSGRTQRPKVPAWVLNALVVRARGRCECCGARGYLHIHHIRRWSRGGTHDLDSLRLVCAGCHRRLHKAEFEEIPSWKANRAAAMQKREEKAWEADRGENRDGAGAADP